jgi:uncharacterized membrane protein YfcA
VRRPSGIPLLSLAAASWALATVTTKVTLEQLTPVDLLAVEVSVGAGAVWIALILRGGAVRAAQRWRSARLGLVEPALAFALFDIGIDRTGAAAAAVLVAAQSIFTAALAGLILRERTTARVGAAVAVGFAGGVTGGLLGVGGGVLFVPALVFFLGLSQLAGEATSLLAIVPVAVLGAWRQHGYGNVRLREGVAVGVLSIPGVAAGSILANALPQRALELAFAGLQLFFAAGLARRALKRNRV